tara:strand:- start:100 stop:549 length:450 start_codon:yes stop_codon:yes gene_type:complete
MRALVYLLDNTIYTRSVSRNVSDAPIVDGKCDVISFDSSASEIGKLIDGKSKASRLRVPEKNIRDKKVVAELNKEWLDASGAKSWKEFYSNSVSLLYDVRDDTIFVMPSQKEGGPYKDAFIQSAEIQLPASSSFEEIGQAIVAGLRSAK